MGEVELEELLFREFIVCENLDKVKEYLLNPKINLENKSYDGKSIIELCCQSLNFELLQELLNIYKYPIDLNFNFIKLTKVHIQQICNFIKTIQKLKSLR